MDSTVEERDVLACQSPEVEGKNEAAAASEGSTAVSHGQDVPKESTTTSSPDTDSPVMINVDVSSRLKLLLFNEIMLRMFIRIIAYVALC